MIHSHTSPTLPHQTVANRMVRKGDTLGMVMSYLKKQGLSEEQCKQTLIMAVAVDVRRKKRVGIGWSLLGLVTIALAALLFWKLVPAQPGPLDIETKFPLVTAMFGLMVFIYGIVSFRNAD